MSRYKVAKWRKKLSRYLKIDRWVLAQCRGTSCLGAINLSRSRILIEDRCASPGLAHYEFVLVAGAKAKTVTNNLPLLSVLWLVVCPELLQGTRS